MPGLAAAVKRNGLFRVRVLQPHRLAAAGVARCGAATLRAGGVRASAHALHGCRLRGCAAARKAIRLREPEAGGKRGAKGLHCRASEAEAARHHPERGCQEGGASRALAVGAAGPYRR